LPVCIDWENSFFLLTFIQTLILCFLKILHFKISTISTIIFLKCNFNAFVVLFSITFPENSLN